MKIKKIKLEGFRRFKDLTIKRLPKEARLVVMIGPNGSGKSSVFDALHRVRYRLGKINRSDPDSYLIKHGLSEKVLPEEEVYKEPEVEFHTAPPVDQQDWRKSVHVRTAYRNDSADSSNFLRKTNTLTEELRFKRLAENDRAVALNYDRILSPWVERVSARKHNGETVDEIESDLYGELEKAIEELFKNPQLTLIGMGNPKDGKIFEFNKGTSHRFSYENLSSGEKAALDLVLDIIVAKAEFNDTVFCIDEPEAHIHTKLQGPLLGHLYKLIPKNSQLWIATHSIGMVRKAQDLWHKNKDTVVFLDFGKDHFGRDHNFDEPVTLIPTEPNPILWEQTYGDSFVEFTELIASEIYIFCEGENLDETCYQKIFASSHPKTRFISIGGRNNVEKAVKSLNGKIAKGAQVIGVIDGDKATCGDKERYAEVGIRILSRKSIESYLFDDEVLTKLCEYYDKCDKIEGLLDKKRTALHKSISEGKSKSTDDLKPIAQNIHVAAQNALEPVKLGINKESFMMDELAPRIQPDMAVYKELHKDIFGD